jgi:Arc/MetJ family transcription regulator
MAKTLIDVDDQLLADARTLLGTTTKKDTVNAALRAVIERQRRVEAFEDTRAQSFLADLTDPKVREQAWRGVS